MEFTRFPKIPRLSRECVITEKIDGTNASIYIGEDGTFLTGSRTRWITPESDNFGFSAWAHRHKEELIYGLGYGHHTGEWWGSGIQRNYGLKEKRFSLFNVGIWNRDNIPACCLVVPVLYQGNFQDEEGKLASDYAIHYLRTYGSLAAPGFMNPEGIILYHTAARQMFKKTLEQDSSPKGQESIE